MNSDSATVTQVEPHLWVERYGDYLFRYANSRLRSANAAEEVVQETFLNGIKYLHQFTGKGSQQAWLLGILKRKIVDYVRKRNKHERAQPYENEHDPTNQLFDDKGNWRQGAIPWSLGPEREMESAELWQIVNDCLAHLPSGQADVVVLSVMEGMDTDQICKELAITPSNLWVRMHRARLGLANCVGSKWFSDDEGSNHDQ